MIKFGVIGLGGRIDGLLKWVMAEECDGFLVTAITDVNEEQTRKRILESPNVYAPEAAIYSDADEMLDNEQLDGVFVGTRCSLHTKMAVKVIKKGIPLFLEKPVSTTMEDIILLNEARKKYNPKVIVSFPLRTSIMTQMAKEIIDSGKIGTVEQVQAYNDVPYGRCYFRSWYRDTTETGGLWLQKATHDLDCINYLVGQTPSKLCAMYSKQIFKGDMPADLTCDICDKNDNCPESERTITKVYRDEAYGSFCSYSAANKNEDSGSVLMRYKSGMHALYSQNFFSNFKAVRRGGRYYGYKGTLELNLYKSEINVYMHTANRVDTYHFNDITDPHFGGDQYLMRTFMDMAQGKEAPNLLLEGLNSALTCLIAKQSCETDKFLEIPELD